MPVSQPDISLVLSGGTNNLDPNLSLGGNPSSLRITSNNLNNLFSDVTPEEAEVGKEDYRCLYLFNDGTDYVYNIEMWMTDEVSGGSSIEVGLQIQDEVQRITITGGVTGGSFQLSYDNHTITSTFNSDLGVWATNLQTSLRAITSDDEFILEDVVVTAQNVGTTVIFDVSFRDENGSRNHDAFVIVSNSLTPTVTINVSTIQQGAPINTIAPTLDVETTPPGGVTFFIPTSQAPLSLPNLGPSDGFPIWFRRTTPVDATALADDGFSLRIRMQSLKPGV